MTPEERARLSAPGGVLSDANAVTAETPYQSEATKAFNQGIGQLEATNEGLGAVGNALVGRENAARRGLRRAQQLEEQGAANAPRVSSIRDVKNPGDALEYVQNTALTQGPNLAVSLLGGGLGAAVGKRVGLRAAGKALAGTVEGDLAKTAVKGEAVAATEGVAKAQLRDRAVAAARKLPAAKEAAGHSAELGAALGAAATSVGLETGSMVDNLQDVPGSNESMQSKAAKTLAGGVAAGSIDALPAFRLLHTSGLLSGIAGTEVKALAGKMHTRILREAGKQAVAEGGTELAQTIIERASRKWIDDRIGLLDHDAFNEYIDATAAGATLGGLSGGMAMFPHSVAQALSKRKPTGSAAGDVAQARDAIDIGNDTIDFSDDSIHDEDPGDQSIFDFGQQQPVSPEAYTEQMQGIPSRAVNMLRDQRPTGDLRSVYRPPAERGTEQGMPPQVAPPPPAGPNLDAAQGPNVAATVERALKDRVLRLDARDAAKGDTKRAGNQKLLEDLVGPQGAQLMQSGIKKLFQPGSQAKTLTDEPITEKNKLTHWNPSQSLLASVKERGSLSGEEVAAIRQLDDLADTPAKRRAVFERFARESSNTAEDVSAQRADAGKVGGVKVSDRELKNTHRGAGTSAWMQDRAMRSALRDVASDGDPQANDVLDSLDSRLQAALKNKKTAEERTTAADAVYASVRNEIKGSGIEAALGAVLENNYATTLDNAITRPAQDADAESRKLQVEGKNGERRMVDVPHLINLVRARSAEKTAPTDAGFLQQVADAYGKALELLKTQSDLVAQPEAMARGNLVLYQKDGKKITLADVHNLMSPELRQQSADFDPENITPTVGDEVSDNRVPGGDTFVPSPKRAIEPQADVIEAMMGAPPEQANARIEAKPKGDIVVDDNPETPRGHQIVGEGAKPEFDDPIAALQAQIRDLGDKATQMTPDERRAANISGQMKDLRAQLSNEFDAAKAAKRKRAQKNAPLVKGLRERIAKVEALPAAAKPAVAAKPIKETGREHTEVDKRRIAARAKAIGEFDAKNEPLQAAKRVETKEAKKRQTPKVKAAKAVANETAARLEAKLAADNAEHAAKRAAETALMTEPQKKLLLGRIKATFPNALAKYEAAVETMTIGEGRSLMARINKAVRERSSEDTIDDVPNTPKKRERATPVVQAYVDHAANQSERLSEAKLNHLASQLLDHFGLDADVIVRYVKPSETNGFGKISYDPNKKRYVIHLRDTLRGADAVTSLSHELGHLIERHMQRTASDETKTALREAYEKWLKGQPSTKHMYDVLASRAPAARQELFDALGLRGTGPRLADMSLEAQSYATMFDEWFADQVARFITTDKKAVGAVEQFFADVAAKLRELATLFKGKAKPDAAVKAYLQALRPTTAQRVDAKRTIRSVKNVDGTKLPEGVTPTEAHAAVTDVTDPNAIPTTMREIFRKLPKGAKAVLSKIVQRGPMITKLRELVSDPGTLAAMDDPVLGVETRMVVAYKAWRNGLLNIREAQGTFRTVWTEVMRVVGVLTESDYFEQFLGDVQQAKVGRNPERYDLFHRTAHGKGALAKSLAEVDRYYRGSLLPLADKVFLTGVGERLRATRIPALAGLAVKFKAGSGEQTSDIGLFPARHREANRLNTALGRAIDGLDQSDLDQLQEVLMQAAPASSLSPEQRAAYNKINAHLNRAYDYLQEAGVKFDKRANYYPIVMKDAVELAGQREEFLSYFANNFDAQMRAKLKSLWIEGLDADVPADAEKLKKIHKELFGKDAKTGRELAENFYAMATGEDRDAAPPWLAGARPSFRYMNEQLMDFVLKGTPAQRSAFAAFREPNLAYTLTRYNEAAAKRAEFNRRFPTEVKMVDGRRVVTNPLLEALKEARKQGATQEEIDLTHDFVDVMMGSYGLGYPPAIKHLLGGIDKVFGSKLAQNPALMRKVQGFLVVYQNVRLLALATLSSIVDSFGIAIRSGKVKDAWAAYRDTFKSIRKNGSMEDMWKLAEDLGVVETTATNEALASAYGGLYLSRGARQVNDFFFKAIGLTRWTQATRVAAVAMAHRFLLRHADGSGKHSARYNKELGLKPGDIEAFGDFVKMKTGDSDRDARIHNAMLRFVDESILRPDPSQRPLWASDPNYMLISQYKSFTYAFQSTILKRIGHEFREGNYEPLLLALAYVPMMLATELLREFLQYGEDGNPNRDNWGVAEYAAYSAKRTGLLGPKEFLTDAVADPTYGRLPGTSFLGPSAAQAREVLSDKPAGAKIEAALPMETMVKQHIDLQQKNPERDPRAAAEVAG
jgi:hypothetical protein